MVRPRLVEEGVPIAAGINNNQNARQMNRRGTREASVAMAIEPPMSPQRMPGSTTLHTHPQYMPSPEKSKHGKPPQSLQPKQSSLMKAARGKLPPPKVAQKQHHRPHATKFEIGSSFMGVDDEMRDLDSHDHHNDYIDDDDEDDYIMFGDDDNAFGETIATSAFSLHSSSNHSSDLHHNHLLSSTSNTFTASSPITSNTRSTLSSSVVGATKSSKTPLRRLHHEIGADYRPTERMEGVQHDPTSSVVASASTPLIVMDGANIAYAYADAYQGGYHESSLSSNANAAANHHKLEPDARGIRVACRHFQSAGMRVLVVLPASWFRRKPAEHDVSGNTNALMETEQLQVLQDLRQAGHVVAAPPTDDDDAYALTIAQRENQRAIAAAAAENDSGSGARGITGGVFNRIGSSPGGYVLSNDLFRDAQQRDASGRLKEWLTRGNSAELGPGRISFAFCDMGLRDDYGDRELDIMPNPRHPLVIWMEQKNRDGATTSTS